MSNTVYEMQERFCIHYWLDNESHSMNAFHQNRCEFEYLGLLKELSKILNVDLLIETEAYQEGGLKRWFSIKRRKGAPNQVVVTVLGAFLIAALATPVQETAKGIIELLFEDKEMTQLQKEKLRLEISKLRKDSMASMQNTVIKKKRSNFYESMIKDGQVGKVSFYSEDADSQPVSPEYVIERKEFSRYILATDELPSEHIEGARIEIVAPVLKAGKYKWIGIYNSNTISFKMKSIEFRQTIQSGQIHFKNGSAIICLLKIDKKIDSEGEESVVGFEVERVDSYFENGISIETAEGKLHKRRQKEIRMQTNLFASNSEQSE